MTCCTRLMSIFAKHDDRAGVNVDHLDIHRHDGMPHIGVFGGDYTRLTLCMDCGKIQDWEPISDDEMKEACA